VHIEVEAIDGGHVRITFDEPAAAYRVIAILHAVILTGASVQTTQLRVHCMDCADYAEQKPYADNSDAAPIRADSP
jgi:hypothetical protein